MPKGPSQQPTMTSQPTTVQNAGRLKYADPRDLPSYPSTGLRPDGAAAGAAASLGWQNKKTIETWRPDKSTASGTAATLGWNNTKSVEPWKPNSTSSASAAAALAKNYKMAPSWEPTATSASSRAALLAAGSAGSGNKAAVPRTTHDNWGSSAATQAFNADRSNSMRSGQLTTTPASNQGPKSLAAAKGAMSGARPRSTSTPATPPAKESYPGESLAASNALSGATLAHRASTKPKPLADNAGAVPITTMTRNMFTSHPPVKLEVDEQQNNEKLHASAVAMARQMYLQQQKMADQAKAGQDQPTDQAKPYINLQDAAYKQAQERLAKLYEEHEKNRSMQEYYGNSPAPRRRFSLTSKLRRRASSDGDLEDRQQSEKIRREMSMFSDKLSQVDQKKRQKDRDAVLAAAQRNVKAQLQGMDQKVYNETGRVNPALSSSWEARAQQIAEVNHETRSHNKGKIDIGGGKFMDPSEVNAIAAKRVQPVLEDINTKAENERERQAVIRLEEEAKQAELERHKVRDREVKEIHQKLKDQEKQDEKARRQQEKEEEKAKKEEERAIKAEQKRLAKEEKKKAKTEPVVATTSEHGRNDNDSIMSEESGTQEPVDVPRTTAIDTSHTAAAHTDNEEHKSPESGTSPTSKVKGWIKNRFSRGKSVGEHEKPADKGKGFVGGAALKDTEVNRSTTSLNNRPSSMRDVALAGKSAEPETQERTSVRDSRGVSPVSSEENLRVAKAQIQEDLPALTPPKPIKDPVARTSSSPTRDSRFRENLDQ